MFFTQEDYRKIEQWLQRNSVKDTEFQEALPLNGLETITLVQDEHNKKVFIKDLVTQIFRLGVSDFLNVTDKYEASYITLNEAIKLIPSGARKAGQVITFLNTDGNWQIYQFKGVLNQWNQLDLWEDLFDWGKFVIDSILPDEEDLTKSLPDENGNSYLSLKDRKYEPDNYSGLGRVILRKNIVEVEDPIYGKVKKNYLYQDMINKENTIYEIRYDFDLNGQTITIPENSTLYFTGGSFSNGILVLLNTLLFGFLEFFKKTLTVLGTVKNTDILSEWWEMPEEDCYKQFKEIIEVSNSSNKPLKFNKREYRLLNDGSTVTIKLSIDFNESTLILNTNGREHFRIYVSKESLKDVSAVDFAAISTALTNKTYTAEVFKKYKNTFMYVTSSEVEMMREHSLVSAPLRKREVLYIDANGFLTNTPYNDNISVESGKYYECVSSSYIKNLILKIEDNFTGSLTGGYRYVGFDIQNTPNLSFENIVMPDPNIENYRLVFFSANNCYNLIFKNCNLSNTRNNLASINSDVSAYVLTFGGIINLTFENVLIGNLASGTVWGATGSNYITNWVINNSSLGRIDVHHRLNNLTVTNTVIGMGRITYSGFGTILLKNCKAMSNVFLYPRTDYGSYFDGDIILENCEFINHTKNGTMFAIYISYSNFDFLCTNSHFKYLGCRNLIIKNLKLPLDNNYAFIPVRTYWDSGSTTSSIPYKYAHPNISIDHVGLSRLYIDVWKYLSMVYDKDYPVTINISNSEFIKDASALGFNFLYQFTDLYNDALYYRSTASECSKYIINFHNCLNLLAGDYHNNVEYHASNCLILYTVGRWTPTSGSSAYNFDTLGKFLSNNCIYRVSPDIYKNSRTLPYVGMGRSNLSWNISDCVVTCVETDDLDLINWMINNQLEFSNKDLPTFNLLGVLDNVRIIKPLSDYIGLPENTLVYSILDKNYEAFTYPYFSPSSDGNTLNVDLKSYLDMGCCSFRLNNRFNSTINITIPDTYYGYLDFIVETSGGSLNASHIYLYKNGLIVTNNKIGPNGDLGLMPSCTRYLIYSRGVNGIEFIILPLRMAAPTSERPSSIGTGSSTFDTTLNKPIWWTGSKWVDATGTDV